MHEPVRAPRGAGAARGGQGKDVYLFAGVGAGDVDDAVALVRLYGEAPGGTITDARAAGRLRECLVGRVPG